MPLTSHMRLRSLITGERVLNNPQSASENKLRAFFSLPSPRPTHPSPPPPPPVKASRLYWKYALVIFEKRRALKTAALILKNFPTPAASTERWECLLVVLLEPVMVPDATPSTDANTLQHLIMFSAKATECTQSVAEKQRLKIGTSRCKLTKIQSNWSRVPPGSSHWLPCEPRCDRVKMWRLRRKNKIIGKEKRPNSCCLWNVWLLSVRCRAIKSDVRGSQGNCCVGRN